MGRTICATLCYVKSKGKTLMLHRTKRKNDIHEGRWNGLGGKMERGETPEECVVREVQEESGLKIVYPKLRGVLTFPGFDGENDWIVFLFTANRFKGKLIDSDEGDLEWIPDAKVTALHLWEGDKIFMRWLKKHRFFSAKFIYKKGKFKDHLVCFHTP